MKSIAVKKYLPLLGSILLGLLIGLWLSNQLDLRKEKGLSNKTENAFSQNSFNTAVKKASPAVVNIYSEMLVKQRTSNPFFRERFNSIFGKNNARVKSSLGSGVIFSSDGYILTNQHVIGDTSLNVTVELSDGRKKEARIVGIDKGTDLAVLKIQENGGVPSMEIADSDKLKIGDIVLAIGNPYGLGQSVSMGIVSATGREVNNPYANYIQTDASINKGNSGGALIDTSGRLVGVNTFITSSSGGSEGIGLAIPSVTVLGIINDLIQFGEVRRGWLGFGIDRKSLSLNNKLIVSNVHPNGPAQEAGLKEGDIIIEINKEQSSYSSLFKEFVRSRPGNKIDILILREEKEIELSIITSAERN